MEKQSQQLTEIFEANEGKRLTQEFAYSEENEWPEQIKFEGNSFDFRHDNSEQGNAVYRRHRQSNPIKTEILVVDKQGIVIKNYIWDPRDNY